MEAHYAKVTILAIILMVAVATLPASLAEYSVERAARRSFRERLCPTGLTPVSYLHGGVGGAGSIVVRCVEGTVQQTGARFGTYWDRHQRFQKFDRFRDPIVLYERYP